MRRWCLALLLVGLSLTLFTAGCGSSSANARLLNAFPTQPDLDMLINGKSVASSVAYGTASGYVSVGSGSQHLQVESSGTTNIVSDQTINLGSGSYNTVLSTTSGTSVLTDTHTLPASGDVSVRVINASVNLGTADVYVIAPGTSIATVAATFSALTSPSASAYTSLPAGSYQVIFTLPNQKFAVFSSAALTLTAGQVRSVVGLDNSGGGYTTAVLSDLN